MEPRIDYRKYAQDVQKPLFALEQYVETSGLDHRLVLLLKMRASQINGCAYCLDMHSKDARALGETEQRLYSLDAWAETPFYTDRERAALEWVESITRVSETHVPDEVFEKLKKHFNEKEIIDLTLVAAMIRSLESHRHSVARGARQIPIKACSRRRCGHRVGVVSYCISILDGERADRAPHFAFLAAPAAWMMASKTSRQIGKI